MKYKNCIVRILECDTKKELEERIDWYINKLKFDIIDIQYSKSGISYSTMIIYKTTEL